MEPSQLVRALETVAARLGIPIRYDVMDRALSGGRARTGGGLCRLRGKPLIVLDAGLGPRDHVVTLAAALATFDLDGIYLPPLVRATIHRHGKTRLLEPRPLARVRPGRV